MRCVISFFAHDRNRIADDLVRLRYEASIRPGLAEGFSSMFPAPRASSTTTRCMCSGAAAAGGRSRPARWITD